MTPPNLRCDFPRAASTTHVSSALFSVLSEREADAESADRTTLIRDLLDVQ
jgi:hypothetical protein